MPFVLALLFALFIYSLAMNVPEMFKRRELTPAQKARQEASAALRWTANALGRVVVVFGLLGVLAWYGGTVGMAIAGLLALPALFLLRRTFEAGAAHGTPDAEKHLKVYEDQIDGMVVGSAAVGFIALILSPVILVAMFAWPLVTTVGGFGLHVFHHM